MRSAAFAVAAVLFLIGPAPGAELLSEDQPVPLSADEVSYDRELRHRRPRPCRAEPGRPHPPRRHTHLQRAHGTVTASGNVSLEPTGDVAFADYGAHLRPQGGVIRDIQILLADGSRIAANGGKRTGEKTEFAKAVYSPCPLCEEDPTRAPLWQLKAVRVTHDQEAHRIEYRDAWLEIYGVPVAYTPYFSHPDPTVTARAGFWCRISPSRIASARRSRYPSFTLGPSADATFEPIITSSRASCWAAYRRPLAHRRVRRERQHHPCRPHGRRPGRGDDDEIRGHIDARARFDYDETWRLGADLGARLRQDLSPALRLRQRTYADQPGLPRSLMSEATASAARCGSRACATRTTTTSASTDSLEAIYHYVGEPTGSEIISPSTPGCSI